MPLHPYECQDCGHAWDYLQNAGEGPPAGCPSCQSAALVKRFGVPNFRVRGSGKTFGSVGEDNTLALIREHGRDRAAEILHRKVYGRKGGKKLKARDGTEIVPVRKAEAETVIPWYRSGEVEGTGPRQDRPVDVTKIKDTTRYILTGEKT